MDDLLWTCEQTVLCRDDRTGLRAVIAVDDTTLGPALGGVRFKAYPDDLAAVREAQRLGAAMTLKNAAAGLPYGGGKSVIVAGDPVHDRAALMRAFGRFVDRLGGTYVAAVDMGTGTSDLAEMADVTPHVACTHDDPSPWTALGVHSAIHAAVEHVDGAGLDSVRVLVQGVGHVGAELARLLARDGAEILVADVDAARAAALAQEVGGSVVDPADVVTTPCDVLAPCAVARVVDHDVVDRLACRMIAGGANDTLADEACAAALAARGITYVPDFIANAGGVIHIHGLRSGWDDRRLTEEITAIGDRVASVLQDAADFGHTSLEAARGIAERRLRPGARDGAVQAA